MIDGARTNELSILEAKDGISFEEITALTASVGWGECFYRSQEQWQRILTASKCIAYIKEDDRIIAFGRIVDDGMMCMFYDICVHPDYQGNNIGTLLMEHLIAKIQNNTYISIGLFTWEGNKTVADFYSKLGFVKASAMQLLCSK